MEELVSIITPLYNNVDYLEECINSVINQSYKNWELIIVDDFSSDGSYELALKFSDTDSRIKSYRLLSNSGAAIARNKAIELAKGDFIAFLDSDDIWDLRKLELQLEIMKFNNAAFSHTAYSYITKDGIKLSRKSKVSKSWVKYKDLLKYTEISCLTAMYDVRVIGKFYMPNIRRKQDYMLWLNILKSGINSYPIDLSLAWYRKIEKLPKSSKFKLFSDHYLLLRKLQNLSVFYSIIYTLYWSINGLNKYSFLQLSNGS